jgi:hypothetical protein
VNPDIQHDMEPQRSNIYVVRSVWRRVNKGNKAHLVCRDLAPVKDVKGGGGATGKSKPITGRIHSAGRQ